MKIKSVLFYVIAASLIVAFACQKGENDPFFSLSTRKGRITGNWKVKKAEIIKEDSVFIIENDQMFLTVGNEEFPPIGLFWTAQIERNGNYNINQRLEYPRNWDGSGTLDYTVSKEELGLWNFTGGADSTKSKSQILLLPRIQSTQLSFLGSNIDAKNTLGQNIGRIYNLDELRNSEMVWLVEKKILSSAGEEIEKIKIEFTKE